MDFKDFIKQLSDRVSKVKNNLQTEEATKTALVMPFLQILGYDVFNPDEVMPEFTCDIGTKKGEKIDYAILKDGQPIILMECKHWNQDLNLHDNQLLRYFHVSNAKFGVLTNGLIYRFYTDLESPNKMDEKPFLEIDIEDFNSIPFDELKKFHKSYFDADNILSSASELKYTNEFKAIITKEFNNPSPEFVKLFVKQVYEGVVSAKLLQQFTPLVHQSIDNYINEAISNKLQSALKKEPTEQPVIEGVHTHVEEENGEYITTAEELEAFYIVKSILRTKISVERIIYRDAKNYLGIFLIQPTKAVCRLYLNSSKNKYISFPDKEKREIRYKIESLDDIYTYAEQLLAAANAM